MSQVGREAMHAYMAAGWQNYFLAQAGAAATLTGLIFVAVSLNLQRILAFPNLPSRAAVALLLLLELLLLALVGLVPAQSHVALGVEFVVLGAAFWLTVLVLQARNVGRLAEAHQERYRRLQVRWAAIGQAATLPPIIAGATLIARAGGGLYWVAAGAVIGFAAGMGEAWVLLIEIQR